MYTETKVLSDGSLSTLWVITLFVYVDDALSDNSSDAACLWFDQKWDSTFRSSQGSGGIADFMLNIKINRCAAEKKITLTQSHYIEDMAIKFDQTTGRNYETPMAVNLDLSFDESQPVLAASIPYRQLIGSLLFTSTQTRADTAMPINELARYMENPQQNHWDAGLRALRYLYLTREL